MTRTRSSVAAASLLLIAALVLLPPGTALAGTGFNATFSKGTLTVRVQSGVVAEMACIGGEVTVNTEPAITGGLLCTKVKSLKMLGAAGDESLQTPLMSSIDYPNLTSIRLEGRGGDDSFVPGAFKETIVGGMGSDTIQNTANESNVVVTDSKWDAIGPPDAISGIEEATLGGSNVASDTLDASGFSGSTVMFGGGGDDTLIGGSGPDSLFAGDGNDTYRGNGGPDTLNDVLSATVEGNDAFFGGQGKDTLTEAGDGDLTLGASTLVGAGSDTHAGVENATLTSSGVDADLHAGAFPGFVTLYAYGSGPNVLTAGAGGSSMSAQDGADTFVGGTGSDRARLSDVPGATVTNTGMTSTQGNDSFSSIEAITMEGSSGSDVVDATAFTGSFTFYDNEGLDTVSTGPGDDWVYTLGGTPVSLGLGTDTYAKDFVQVPATLVDASFTDQLSMTSLTGVERFETPALEGAGTFDGSAWSGSTLLESTDDQSQTYLGGLLRDEIYAGQGNDQVQGLAGNDRLFGEQGNDQLMGGVGKDFCDGGNAADSFTSCETFKN